jgi:hypothetical protein
MHPPWPGQHPSASLGQATVDAWPGYAFQACDPGPCWVRTASGTAGPRRAQAVTAGVSQSQVTGHTGRGPGQIHGPLVLGPREGGGAGGDPGFGGGHAAVSELDKPVAVGDQLDQGVQAAARPRSVNGTAVPFGWWMAGRPGLPRRQTGRKGGVAICGRTARPVWAGGRQAPVADGRRPIDNAEARYRVASSTRELAPDRGGPGGPA